MAITLEKQLKALEDELKELKATYKIYGGLAKSYVSFNTWAIDSFTSNFKILFSPNYYTGSKTLVSGIAYFIIKNGTKYVIDDLFMSSQGSDGEVEFNLGQIGPLFGQTLTFQVVSNVPGSLTRIS